MNMAKGSKVLTAPRRQISPWRKSSSCFRSKDTASLWRIRFGKGVTPPLRTFMPGTYVPMYLCISLIEHGRGLLFRSTIQVYCKLESWPLARIQAKQVNVLCNIIDTERGSSIAPSLSCSQPSRYTDISHWTDAFVHIVHTSLSAQHMSSFVQTTSDAPAPFTPHSISIQYIMKRSRCCPSAG